MKIALSIQYDGSQFSGWQRQKHAVRTVQQTLEKSLSKVADSPIVVACAGRTDTGVHGMAQVVHIETDVQRDMKAWVYGGNRFLDYDVSISWAKAMPDDFHARFSAQARQYRYVICNTPIRPAAMRQYVSWNYRPLDAGRMQEAAEYLTGEHDFSSYRAAGCQAKTATRQVRSLTVRRFGSMVVVDICANAFLQHMVRNIVGVLMKIGAGEREPIWAKEVLTLRDRTKGGVTAPPYGLYFVGVEYPAKYSLPEQSVDEFLFPLPLMPDSG
ncbi:MAG: tRNA pseudouridine(38-40) synthase TruA [Gammaproteobacteria bacterium]|nr:tRNA pseudouridine(38-40) synthase TruA [Gammaproteobacteria bacterium]